MAIELKDITKLQQEVRTDIANGAPGRKGSSFGCCVAAPELLERHAKRQRLGYEAQIAKKSALNFVEAVKPPRIHRRLTFLT